MKIQTLINTEERNFDSIKELRKLLNEADYYNENVYIWHNSSSTMVNYHDQVDIPKHGNGDYFTLLELCQDSRFYNESLTIRY